MRFILPIVLLLAATIADAQVRTFRWNTELCEYSGTYDSRKVSETKLKNTLRLMRPGELGLSAGATVWNYEDTSKLDVAALDRNYEKVTAELKNLEIVKSQYWEAIRQKKLKEIEQIYRLSRATMQAYTRPVVLREFQGAASCKKKFAEPIIIGGANLLAAWRKVNEDSRNKNADPERLRRIFDQQYASPDKFKFALVEVMSFGWWNCANEFIEYDEGVNSEAREREFRKLFIRVRKIRCDEP